jgi:GNAT superfamily N-acetyltransferase
MIRLEPMTPERAAAFLEESIRRYAEDNTRSGRWTPDVAMDASRKEHEKLLPDGLDSADQFLRTVHDGASGVRVGDLWYAHRSEGGPKQVWIFWIGIDPQHRRRGYAADALRAVELEARRLGSDRVGLHVFGFNSGARALYEGLGYEVTNLVMWKSVPP